MGFDEEDFLGLNSSAKLGLSLMDKCVEVSEGCSDANSNNQEEVDDSAVEIMGYKNLKKNGENPSFKKRESGTKCCARGHWKPSEDAKLKELIVVYGPQNWNLIAEKLQGRSGKSCRLRWYNQLDPKINKTAFTEEEEERLLEAHRIYGNKWAFISRLFPGRTDNSVKNHWHVLMARKCRDKTKSYVKKKWITASQKPLHQSTLMSTVDYSVKLLNHCGDKAQFWSYDTFAHGNPYSPGSTSQVSFATPITPRTAETTPFVERPAETPKFIDFLGVGGLQL